MVALPAVVGRGRGWWLAAGVDYLEHTYKSGQSGSMIVVA